jgi:signal transduction histidine kinase
MIVRSLRWRLLLAGGVAIFLALVVAWFLMILLFQNHLERRLASELQQDAVRIVAGIAAGPGARFDIEEPPADARFRTPMSGLYWQASYRGRLVRSQSLWDQALPASPAARGDAWETRVGSGPFHDRLVYLERTITPHRGGPPVLVQVAENAAVLDAAGAEFGRELALFLSILWLFLAAAAWLQVHLGLRPLRQIRTGVAALEGSSSARLPVDGASEVRPLVTAINRLADAREQDMERARRRATDLAHGLKTPLAAAAAQLRRAGGDADHVAGIGKALAAMKHVVDAELARSRIAAAGHAAGLRTDGHAIVERLVAVLERTDAGEALMFDVRVPSGLEVPVAGEDLMELLGSIADNAVRHARRQVLFDGTGEESEVVLAIEDDGPGIDDSQMARVLTRGLRLDETGGHGLGLAIARDLAEATGGVLSLSRAGLGGLRVELRWPSAKAR